MEVLPLDPIPVERVVTAVGVDSLSGHGPTISVNRPVRTRTPGGVGKGGAANYRLLPDYSLFIE
jgi:hypothetical protein